MCDKATFLSKQTYFPSDEATQSVQKPIFEAMQRYKRYSRGYKNRAIVQKMFEILPMFDDGLQSQLFKSMAFFVSRTHLTCMLDTFFVSQATWAAEDGRDLTPFLLTELFFT